MTGTITQRRAVIDRMARAVAWQRGRTWERMTAARQAQIRTEVRVALQAMKPVAPDYDDLITLKVVHATTVGEDQPSMEAVSAHVTGWIDEVLA